MSIKAAAAVGISSMVDTMIKDEMRRGASRPDAIKLAMLEVGKIMFDEGGRARRFLARFLRGQREEMPIIWAELEKEDKNVRQRVHGEIVRRVLGIDTITEKLLAGTAAAPDKTCITLFQSTYAILDWKYALGSFDIYYEVINPPKTPRPFIDVKIWGRNEYKWYENDDRVTKKIHEVCSELVRLGKSKPFWMVLKPTTISVEISQANILAASTGFQVNPKAGFPLLNAEQLKKARLKAEELGYGSLLLNSVI